MVVSKLGNFLGGKFTTVDFSFRRVETTEKNNVFNGSTYRLTSSYNHTSLFPEDAKLGHYFFVKADISHHKRRWWTFFKQVYFSIKKTPIFGIFWPLSANFGHFLANLRTFWCAFYRPEECSGVPKETNIGYFVCQNIFVKHLELNCSIRVFLFWELPS